MTNHSDYQALLRAVIAAPDDNLPRLILADWLDEHGEPERAEFIRVQCEIARWPCECDSEERVYHDECRCGELHALRRRERELLPVQPPFLPRDVDAAVTLTAEPVPGRFTGHVRRGFVEQVTCAWPDFARHAAALRAATPLREVVLTTWPTLDTTGGDVSLRLLHVRRYYRTTPGDRYADWQERAIRLLLAAEFPGLAFTLPAADPFSFRRQ